MITAGITHLTVCFSGCADGACALLCLPLAGPIILAALPVTRTYREAPFFTTLLVLDAALQVGGLALAVAGWFWTSRVVTVHQTARWSFAPAAPGAQAGASFGLTF